MQLGTSFGIANVVVPKGGPKTSPLTLDFSNTATIDVDGELVVSSGKIEYLQGVYIDNADNPTAFTLLIGTTNQRVVCPPNSQGYFAIMAPSPPKMTASTTQAANRFVPLFFYNVPIQSAVWKCI